jgi:acyl-CoA synthetase (AMP-forming)/AMP-acid ligase II
MFVALENLAGFEQARAELERPLEDNRVILLCKPEHKPKGTKYHCIFEILSERAEEAEHFDGTDCYETQFLCYSSGTTGLPKGVMSTHWNFTSQMQCLKPSYQKLGPNDRMLGFVPLSHTYGVTMVLQQPFSVGACAVILPRFDEIACLRALEKVGYAIQATQHVTTANPSSSRLCTPSSFRPLSLCCSIRSTCPNSTFRRSERSCPPLLHSARTSLTPSSPVCLTVASRKAMG